MGTWYQFHCKDCRLDAVVSGGYDRGICIQTRTMFCTQCKALHDVLLGNTGDDRVTESDRVDPQNIGKCPKCRGVELIPWKAEEPCPRCGGAIGPPEQGYPGWPDCPPAPILWD